MTIYFDYMLCAVSVLLGALYIFDYMLCAISVTLGPLNLWPWGILSIYLLPSCHLPVAQFVGYAL